MLLLFTRKIIKIYIKIGIAKYHKNEHEWPLNSKLVSLKTNFFLVTDSYGNNLLLVLVESLQIRTLRERL